MAPGPLVSIITTYASPVIKALPSPLLMGTALICCTLYNMGMDLWCVQVTTKISLSYWEALTHIY